MSSGVRTASASATMAMATTVLRFMHDYVYAFGIYYIFHRRLTVRLRLGDFFRVWRLPPFVGDCG
jgi:hypothetical protein